MKVHLLPKVFFGTVALSVMSSPPYHVSMGCCIDVRTSKNRTEIAVKKVATKKKCKYSTSEKGEGTYVHPKKASSFHHKAIKRSLLHLFKIAYT